MNIHPQILVFAISLIAILLIAWLALRMKLGGDPLIADDGDAARLAGEVWDGFEPVAIVVGQDRKAALLRDEAGRIMLIRRHGNRYAGRILTPAASASADACNITIHSGEARFGGVALTIEDASDWAETINRLNGVGNA